MFSDIVIYFEKECFDEKQLAKGIKDFFKTEATIKRIGHSVIEYYNFYKNNEITIALYWSSANTPGEFFESTLIENVLFPAPQSVQMTPDKFARCNDLYNMELDFCLYLQKLTGCNAHVYSDLHGDLCCIRDGKTIWNRKVEFIQERLSGKNSGDIDKEDIS